MDKIAIIIPTLDRAEKLQRVIDNIHENTSVPHTIYFIIEKSDLASKKKIKELGEKFIFNEGKLYVGAINTGYRKTKEPFVMAGSDDLDYSKDWDVITLEDFKDKKIGMIGYPDEWPISKTGLHGSHFSVRRTYIEKQSGVEDEKNVIYFSGYWHQHCDIETENTAQKRRAWKQSKAIITHLHWSTGKQPIDPTYEKSIACNPHDWAVYCKRRYKFEQHIFNALFAGKIVKPFKGKLSVVMPSYNQSHYTKLAVESLKKTTFNPYELIIVDHSDEKESIAYIKSLKCKKIINKVNSLFTQSVNEGVAAATGDYIAVVNNDITFSDCWDCYLMAALEGDVWVANPYQNDPGCSVPYGKNIRTGSIDIRGSCFMFKKELVKKLGWKPKHFLPEQMKHWYSDWYLGWEICTKNKKQTRYVPEAVIFHYGQKSTEDFEKKTGKLREIIEHDKKEFQKLTGLDGEVVTQFNDSMKRSMKWVIPQTSGSFEKYFFAKGVKIELPESVIYSVGIDNFIFE